MHRFPPPIRRTRTFAAGCTLLLFAGCARSAPPAALPAEVTAFVGVNVLPMDRAGVLPAQTVLVHGGRIVRMGPAGRVRVPAGARRIEGRGRYLMPGLWDMHAHAWSRGLLEPVLLAHGITGIREMGTGMDGLWGNRRGVWDWRRATREEGQPGVRVVAAGMILNGGDSADAPAPFFAGIPTPAEGRRWVDSLADRGADFLKVYGGLAPETYAAITERARERKIPFAGHVPWRVGARAASDAGQRSFEHLFDLLTSCSTDEAAVRAEFVQALDTARQPATVGYHLEARLAPRLIATHDARKCDALMETFRRNQTWQVPTLVVHADPRFLNPAATLDSARLARTPPGLHMMLQLRGTLTEERRAAGRARLEKEMELLGRMHRAGVPILAGSDFPQGWTFPGYGLHDELALLVRAGVPPQEALRAATLNPARYLQAADSLGSVGAGKVADLLLLEANPLDDIASSRRIAGVMVRGVWMDRAELDRRLDATLRPSTPRP